MRYVVVGTSGSGKSMLARSLAQAQGAPLVELDELHWAEHWTPRPTAHFVADVAKIAQGERWVVEGNYSVVRPVLWPRATHVVWLNYSRSVVFSRVIWRTLKRAVFRQKLWHGNQESLRQAFFSKDSIVLWSVTTYAKNLRKYAQLRQEPAFAHLTWVELKSPAQAREFIARGGRAD
jgi:adenylate kinase family enzyme